MNPATREIKTLFLRILIGSVALSALLGVWAMLSGDFGWFQARVLLTSITISATSICGFGCGAYLATGRGRLLPRAGIGLAVLAGLMILAGIWAEVHEDAYWKLCVAASAFAVACAHVCLLGLASLAPAHRWSFRAAFATSFALAALVTAWAVFEIREDAFFRLLGVAGILSAALTVLVPILHRMGGAAREPGLAVDRLDDIDAEIGRLRARIAELEEAKARLAAG